MARMPDQVTFRDVIEAVDGPMSLNICVSEQHDCSVLSSCNMQGIWQEGQRRMLEYFADKTLADLNPIRALNTSTEIAV